MYIARPCSPLGLPQHSPAEPGLGWVNQDRNSSSMMGVGCCLLAAGWLDWLGGWLLGGPGVHAEGPDVHADLSASRGSFGQVLPAHVDLSASVPCRPAGLPAQPPTHLTQPTQPASPAWQPNKSSHPAAPAYSTQHNPARLFPVVGMNQASGGKTADN